jgi:hypothetical protein
MAYWGNGVLGIASPPAFSNQHSMHGVSLIVWVSGQWRQIWTGDGLHFSGVRHEMRIYPGIPPDFGFGLWGTLAGGKDELAGF